MECLERLLALIEPDSLILSQDNEGKAPDLVMQQGD